MYLLPKAIEIRVDSIMAEAIAILGAIRSMTSVLLEFADLVDRYRRLPERIQDLRENLRACEVTLRRWKHKWGVEDRQPSKFPTLLYDIGVPCHDTRIVQGERCNIYEKHRHSIQPLADTFQTCTMRLFGASRDGKISASVLVTYVRSAKSSRQNWTRYAMLW